MGFGSVIHVLIETPWVGDPTTRSRDAVQRMRDSSISSLPPTADRARTVPRGIVIQTVNMEIEEMGALNIDHHTQPPVRVQKTIRAHEGSHSGVCRA